MLDSIMLGIATATSFNMILAVFVGVVVGVFVGMLPGLTSTMGVALLIPLTFSVQPEVGLALLGGIYCASSFSGSISAILLNIPGTPSAVATCQDGFPLAKNGNAGLAIGLSVFSSCIGGTLSTIALLFLAPLLASVSLLLGAYEYFLLALFGVTIIASLSEGDMLKALLSGVLGLIASLVGIHSITGDMRLTFDIPALYDGIPLVVSLIGLYSIPEVISILSEGEKQVKQTTMNFNGMKQAFKETLAQYVNLIRSSIIGIVVGVIPGAGQSIASFIAYDAAKKSSKTPQDFGHGSKEGLIASESANNGTTGGSLVPLLTLGIPGNAVAAVLMGGLIIHGLNPGPLLFQGSPEVAYGFIVSLFFSNILFVPIGLIIAKYCVKIITLPKQVLAASILILAVVGAFAIRSQVEDIIIMVAFGFIGYIFNIFKISRAPMVLGLVLGGMAETNLARALVLAKGDVSILLQNFFTKPASLALILLCLFSIIYGFKKNKDYK